MNALNSIQCLLQQAADPVREKRKATFFQTGPGQYAEHDRFIGVDVPTLHKISKSFSNLPLEDIQTLIEFDANEERLLALFILVRAYQKANAQGKEEFYQFYLRNLKHVNNWNLVDASAHLIIGAHLLSRDRDFLLTLAQSENLWKRRISIVSTWFFIRHNDLAWTFKLSERLLKDPHDLMHKAVGWMLREAGKKDQAVLIDFLDQHTLRMPRTMLRYAIEKFPEPERKAYLMRGKA